MSKLDGFHVPFCPTPQDWQDKYRQGLRPVRWRIEFYYDDIDRLVIYLQDLDAAGLLDKVGMTSADVAALDRVSSAIGMAPFAFTLFCDNMVHALQVAWVCGLGEFKDPKDDSIWNVVFCEDWELHPRVAKKNGK